MFFSVKKLNRQEKNICLKTISSRAIFAIVGDAIKNKKSISVVRMGDGEQGILRSDPSKPFDRFNHISKDWNKTLGVGDMSTKDMQKNIIKAGNTCTYFAPSVSGISYPSFNLYKFFKQRSFYFDNFYVADWTRDMIKMILESSDGVFILHRDYKKIIADFKENYNFENEDLFVGGFTKDSWKDNKEAVEAAKKSKAQLILFSAGPAGKIIGPEIAKAKNKIVLDIGNTMIPWSTRKN